MTVRESRLRISVIDGVTGRLGKIQGALGQFHRRNQSLLAPLSGTIGRLAALGGAYFGVTHGMQGTIGAAREMQAALTEIGIKADMPQSAIEQLRQSITALSPRVNQTTSDLLSGVDAMVTLGLSADQAVAAMPAIGKTATATMSSIADLSASSVAAMQNFKVAPSEIARMLDAMAEAGNQGAFEMRDMAQHFPALTASAASLGMEGVDGIIDMAAALQIARRGAGDASTAANNLSNFLGKIMSPEVSKRFKKFGVNTTKELQKAHKLGVSPIEHFMKLVDQKTKGGRADLLGQLFGDKQVLDFVRPMLSDFKDYIRIREDAERANGTVDKAYARRMEDAEQKIRAFRIQMGNLGLLFGAKALAPLGDFAGRLAHIFDTLDKRVGVFDKLKAAFDGFASGLGQKDAASMIGNLGDWLEEGIFGKEFTGSIKEVDGRVSELAKLSNRFREIGRNVRQFANDVADNPIARFLAEMSGHGFKLMLASAGIGMLASAIWKLGKAAAFLSGLTAAVGIVKGLTKVGGALVGIGATVATAATASGKGKGASVAAAGAKQGGGWLARWLGGEGVKDLVGSGRKSTQLTALEQAGKATGRFGAAVGMVGRGAGRLLGTPAIAAEVTARALIEKGLTDERFKDPDFAPWAMRNAEDRAAGRESIPMPETSKAVPFSFKSLFADLMKPAGSVGSAAIDTSAAEQKVAELKASLTSATAEWPEAAKTGLQSYANAIAAGGGQAEAEANRIGEGITEALTVEGQPSVDTSQLQRALEMARQIGNAMQGLGSAKVAVPTRSIDGARAKGGDVRAGGTYLVGEEGPEIVTFPKSGLVHDAARSARMMRSPALMPPAAALPAEGQASARRKPLGLLARSSRLDGARAKGGDVRAGGTYLVGEEGPEIVTFPSSGPIGKASKMVGMMRNAAIATSAMALPAAAQTTSFAETFTPPGLNMSAPDMAASLGGASFDLAELFAHARPQATDQRQARSVNVNFNAGAFHTEVKAQPGQSTREIAEAVEKHLSTKLTALYSGMFNDGAN